MKDSKLPFLNNYHFEFLKKRHFLAFFKEKCIFVEFFRKKGQFLGNFWTFKWQFFIGSGQNPRDRMAE